MHLGRPDARACDPSKLPPCQPAAGPTGGLVDISPHDFVRLVLPVYKAMFEHMPTFAMLASGQYKRSTAEVLRSMKTLNHYTTVSFGRLLVSAGRRLRLSEAHFEAALQAICNSGLILAPNLQQEQVSAFLGRPSPKLRAPCGRVVGVKQHF